MKIINKTSILLFAAFSMLSLASCDDLLNPDATQVVEDSENYKNVYDADNAI